MKYTVEEWDTLREEWWPICAFNLHSFALEYCEWVKEHRHGSDVRVSVQR